MASYKGRVTPPGYPKKQSTPSRARHSSSIFAPFVRVDIYSSTERSPKTKKATSRLGSPRWWPRNSSDAASSGAGYDDQYDNNNDDYRYRKTGQTKYPEEPVCGTARHE